MKDLERFQRQVADVVLATLSRNQRLYVSFLDHPDWRIVSEELRVRRDGVEGVVKPGITGRLVIE